MDDYMETAQRNHAEATRIHQEFMQQAIEQHHFHNKHEASEAEMEQLEREFQKWMKYIHDKKLD